jgi:hypothetical protein
VWVIVGDDGASGDDGVFALTSLVIRGLAVRCGGLEIVVVLFFFFFFELSSGSVQFVSMSQSDRLGLFFFSFC